MTSLRHLHRVCGGAIALLACLIAQPAAAQTTVIGNVYRDTPYGQLGVAGVMVTVSNDQVGRSYPAFADADGWFALYNIAPGNYTLEAWADGQQNPPITSTIVVPSAPEVHLPPMRLPASRP